MAANEKKQKTNGIKFDDTGLAALVCRHDIPLFFANIDTPGEQPKYMVVLLGYLFSLLPPQTTVICLYNVRCVLDQSLQLMSLLSYFPLITDKFLTILSVRHLAPQNHGMVTICHICNACVWAPMELSTCL